MILELIERRGEDRFRTGCWVDEGRIPPPLAEALAGLGGQDWPANLVLADDGTVAAMNGRYRNREGVTDVLSFSYLLAEGRGDPDLRAGNRGAACDLWRESPPDVVGEVILAPDFVARRCLREGWSVGTEFTLLVIHGCLHLLGWDHGEPEMARTMRGLETELLGGMGMSHPLA